MKIKRFKEYVNEAISMKPEFKKGDLVVIISDNDSYDEYKDKVLQIVNVATNKNQHPFYDNSMMGSGLYDLIVYETGEDVPFSLYDYELELA